VLFKQRKSPISCVYNIESDHSSISSQLMIASCIGYLMEISQSSAVLGGAAYGTGSRSAGSCRAESRSGKEGRRWLSPSVMKLIRDLLKEMTVLTQRWPLLPEQKSLFFMFKGYQV
jgi:hypothetical protein